MNSSGFFSCRNMMGLTPWFRRPQVQFFSSCILVVLLVSNCILNNKGEYTPSHPLSKISRKESLSDGALKNCSMCFLKSANFIRIHFSMS